MLKLIIGRAKTGKTAMAMREIGGFVREGRGGAVLLVPEQYSHEAEMELLRVCGDSMPLYAEVMSFKRLALRVLSETGGERGEALDAGGRLLCMALAVDAVSTRLELYGAARGQAKLLAELLQAVDELKSAHITPAALLENAEKCPGALGRKLRDMALISEAYESACAAGYADPTDRLELLAQKFGESSLAGGSFYLDGFTDFTKQELGVVEAMLRSGTEVAVCLTCEGLSEGHEIFESSRRAAVSLCALAKSVGQECRIVLAESEGTEGAMGFLERELFAFSDAHYDLHGEIRLVEAASMSDECEAAAAHCIELARAGCRWRDIAIAVRGYEDYRAVLEATFEKYGVPIYSSGKSELSSKPLVSLIREAYEVVNGGWSCESVSAYIKTGLTGLSPDEAQELCAYAWLWNVSGSAWLRQWRMHPEGYGGKYTPETEKRLARINGLREKIAAPLAAFKERGSGETALDQTSALSGLFDDISLPETLEKRAAELRGLGLEREAGEYAQLWDIIVSALEQCAAVLGGVRMTQEEFSRLFLLMLSQYSVGTIPLTLDRVLAGDMDRMRRRHIKHLLILGCEAERIPAISQGGGVFSDDDRQSMLESGLDIGNSAADRLEHEFALIYNCASLPGESIYLSRMTCDGRQPSFIMTRCESLFGAKPLRAEVDRCRLCAVEPAFELASRPGRGFGGESAAAFEYFSEIGRGDELLRLRAAADSGRGRLSRGAAASLYGKEPVLSASRIDRFESCRFAYFLQYGLKAKPKRQASFSPPEMGVFMHFVLEGVAREVEKRGGFKSVSPETVEQLCDDKVQEYIDVELGGFAGKTARFVWLFNRLRGTAKRIVLDMAEELAVSDFQPLEFELDFSSMPDDGRSMRLTGIADRVDGWMHEGKLYLRVVDYKTGRKKFSLSDVWYGMGLQMLLYLFTLSAAGFKGGGMEVVPAGVMYIPARESFVSSSARPGQGELEAEITRQKRRSGLLLCDDEVLAAMEGGDSPRFIPVSIKKGKYTGEALATAEQLGQLSGHVERLLKAMGDELRAGSIEANPYYRSKADNACANCDFAAFCGFDAARDSRRCLSSMKAAEVWERLKKEAEENGL